ncbi:MAG: VCBS repeat-containing protein [Pyrinomonadaceae bacterium]
MRESSYTKLTAYVISMMLIANLFVPVTGYSVEAKKRAAKPIEAASGNGVYFEENRGQFDEAVKYRARGTNGFELFLTATDAVYVLRNAARSPESKETGTKTPALHSPDNLSGREAKIEKRTAVYMSLEGANMEAEAIGSEREGHKTNYFKGNEDDWVSSVPNFGKVRYESVYEGIDIVWTGIEKGGARYDFEVSPGADPESIVWDIRGADEVSIEDDGSLMIITESGILKQAAPVSFQENGDGNLISVQSGFRMIGINKVAFALGEYDPTMPLTIDPNVSGNLQASTLLGTSEFDKAAAMTLSNGLGMIVAGNTQSTQFPTTPGTYDVDANGNGDGFVAGFSSDGSTLLFATYIGGDNFDNVTSATTTTGGEIVIAGSTVLHSLAAFPTTAGAHDRTHNGSHDGFVTVFDSNAQNLIASTLIGSDFDDIVTSVDVDTSNNIYVGGYTEGGEIFINPFPTTPGAFDQTQNGARDGFVAKLGLNATLTYSTFIGGSGNDAVYRISQNGGSIHATGETASGGLFGAFPTTDGAYDRTYNGGATDGFLAKFNTAATGLEYSTYIGGDGQDAPSAIAVSGSSVTIAGFTGFFTTTPFPTTTGAADTTPNGNTDAFVATIQSGTQLSTSTLIGGEGNDGVESIAIGVDGKVHVAGFTGSASFPIAGIPLDSTYGGAVDCFVTSLDSNLSEYQYSTYFGGGGDDYCHSLKYLLGSGGYTLYLAGETDSGNPDHFPVTSNAYDTSFNGGRDAFVSKIGFTKAPSNQNRFDFDGDSKADIAIFRPNGGEWWYLRSSDGGNNAFSFGASTDIATPGDFSGDGRSDFAFWRPSTGEWYVLRSENASFYAFPFGTTGDIPAPGDYDGDGKTDAAVFRPSTGTWFILRSSDSQVTVQPFGANGDKPLVGDFDNDGKDDIAIYRPGVSQYWLLRSTLGTVAYQFGNSGDNAFAGDFTGDGTADIGFFRPSTREWFVLRSEDQTYFAFGFGAAGDRPIPADYDGDGVTDPAVFRPGSNQWFLVQSTAGIQVYTFGSAGDRPVEEAYVVQ